MQMESIKTTVCFLKAVEFWPTLTFKLAYNFSYISGKVAKAHILESQQKSLKYAHIHINRATHYEITALYIYEKFVFFFTGRRSCYFISVNIV